MTNAILHPVGNIRGNAGSRRVLMAVGVPPVNTVAPSLSGADGLVGTTVTCDPGTWTDASSYAYQWRRNEEDIAGATGDDYTLTTADAEQTLDCVVTATGPGGSASETSDTLVPDALLEPPMTAPPLLDAPSYAVGDTANATAGTFAEGANPPISGSEYSWWLENTGIYTQVSGESGTSVIVPDAVGSQLFFRHRVLLVNGETWPAVSPSPSDPSLSLGSTISAPA